MKQTHTIESLIEKFNLQPHPEGGFYQETFRSNDQVKPLDARYKEGLRSAGTSIYFLLTQGNFSAWHTVNSDEIWNYHAGDDLILYVIHPTTQAMQRIALGPSGEYQFTVPSGHLFAAETTGTYTLVGCAVMPGFEFQDFCLISKAELTQRFQNHIEWNTIERFVRD